MNQKVAWQVVEKIMRTSALFGTALLITNSLGFMSFGDYSFLLNNFLIAIALANFGTSNFVASEASCVDVSDSLVLGTFLSLRFTLSLFTSVCALTAIIVSDYALTYMFALLIFAILLSTLDVFENYNIGKDRYVGNLKIKCFVIAIGVTFRIYCSIYDYTWEAYLIIYLAEYILTLLIIAISVMLQSNIRLTLSKAYISKNLPKILALSVTSILALLTLRIDQYVLVSLFSKEELGRYNLIFSIINVTTFFPLIVFYIKLPLLSKSKNIALLQKDEHVSTVKNFILAGAVGCLAAITLSSAAIVYYDLPDYYWVIVLVSSFLPLVTASALYQAILIVVYNYQILGLQKVALSFATALLLSFYLANTLGVAGIPLGITLALLTAEIFFYYNIDYRLTDNLLATLGKSNVN